MFVCLYKIYSTWLYWYHVNKNKEKMPWMLAWNFIDFLLYGYVTKKIYINWNTEATTTS